MRIIVKVKTGAKKEGVEKEDYFKVSVKALPVKGKANREVIKLIADYFKTDTSRIRIVSGIKSSKKVIDII